MTDPLEIIMKEINDHSGDQYDDPDDDDPFSGFTRHAIDS
jgi:hypothetical protein